MKAFWVQMNDLDLFFRYLKGRCHGNQFCGKMDRFQDTTTFEVNVTACDFENSFIFDNVA